MAITRSQNKLSFIADTLEPLIKSNRLYVMPWMLDKQRCDFLAELERFPAGKKDDHLDAVAGAIHERHLATLASAAVPSGSAIVPLSSPVR